MKRRCYACKKMLPLTGDNFCRNAGRFLGFGSECKRCKAAYEKLPETAARRRLYLRTIQSQWSAVKVKARALSVPMTLTLKQYSTLRLRPCYYCGGKLPATGRGLDQIIPRNGYTLKNSRPCCTDCNKAKNSLSELQFMSLIKSIFHNWANKYKII